MFPLLVGVVLAVAIGGWTSLAVAMVSWVGLAVMIGLGLRAGMRIWSPVRSLVDTAGRLADGDYTARAEPASRAPLRQVVESVNHLAERLERTEKGRQQLLADVGHEIRTPLTIVRGELEAIIDGVRSPDDQQLHRLLGDIDLMERLLDDLTTLSQAEAGVLTIHREPTDVLRLVQDVLDGLQPAAVSAEVSTTVTAENPVEANIDPIRLREMTTNLLTNALRATPPGGRVDVSIGQDVGHVVIQVADTGHGLPAEDIERVFERFSKGPTSSGSGLGLTISRDLARAHGGDLVLASDQLTGTTATITLPLGP